MLSTCSSPAPASHARDSPCRRRHALPNARRRRRRQVISALALMDNIAFGLSQTRRASFIEGSYRARFLALATFGLFLHSRLPGPRRRRRRRSLLLQLRRQGSEDDFR